MSRFLASFKFLGFVVSAGCTGLRESTSKELCISILAEAIFTALNSQGSVSGRKSTRRVTGYSAIGASFGSKCKPVTKRPADQPEIVTREGARCFSRLAGSGQF